MLPISLDLAKLRVMLVGGGQPLLRRLELLEEAGPEALEIYAPAPEPRLVAIAGARLRRRLPEAQEIARARLVFVAGTEKPIAEEIRRVAQAAGVLINVEDDRARSDFHSAAVIRRGDLVVAVSTNGKSPGLAALMRQMLERRIGPEWGTRLDRIAALRKNWRAGGADAAAIGRRTREWAARHGWIDASREPPSRLP
ncbi:MAG TPA: NAD(P)-dependent oxidoreductase [Stellaceae bacterium]|jgi:precorrin-2 dehydrogenase/sirohydrochlorin ferrochelatase